jgi:hypothetical protein
MYRAIYRLFGDSVAEYDEYVISTIQKITSGTPEVVTFQDTPIFSKPSSEKHARLPELYVDALNITKQSKGYDDQSIINNGFTTVHFGAIIIAFVLLSVVGEKSSGGTDYTSFEFSKNVPSLSNLNVYTKNEINNVYKSGLIGVEFDLPNKARDFIRGADRSLYIFKQIDSSIQFVPTTQVLVPATEKDNYLFFPNNELSDKTNVKLRLRSDLYVTTSPESKEATITSFIAMLGVNTRRSEFYGFALITNFMRSL